MNFHKNHIWSDENPHTIVESRFQRQFSTNYFLTPGLLEEISKWM